MTYEPFQQNDAAEFLMLLVSHLEDSLKGTSHDQVSGMGGKATAASPLLATCSPCHVH